MLLMAACAPGAIGPRYRGEALFTVKGQLVASGPAPTTPIRLAVAWYPNERTDTAPKAIVTQDVEYQGSFPLNYTFSFFTVPEVSALHEYVERGVTTRAAFGVLLAYEDRNGNGRLDSIVKGGGPVDRVLGTSVGDTYNGAPAAAPVWVAYVEGTPPESWTGYGPGYNLYQRRGVVPSDTDVPITLTGSNELNFFVCEEFISGSGYAFDLPCNLPPTSGVRVIGNLQRIDGFNGGSLRVTDGRSVLANAIVSVNDAGVPFAPTFGLYLVPTSVPLNVPGVNVVTVTPLSGSPLRFVVEAPDDFALQAPTSGHRHLSGQPLSVQWTRSAAATFYQVQAFALTPPNDGPEPVIVPSSKLAAALSPFTNDDLYQVLVSAFAPNYLAHGPGASLVNVSASRSTFIDVKPPDIGLWINGSAAVAFYRGQQGASAWVEALDGVTAVEDAVVTVNGQPLPWDRRTRQYGGAIDLEPGGTATFGVSRAGSARTTFTVALPGEFTVTALPASHPVRTPLRLTWASAPNASVYRVAAIDAAGRQLHFEELTGTEATLPGLEAPGAVTVVVAAVRPSSSRHLIGLIQQSFELTLTQ
jgi:hypothetical protein